MKILGYIFLIAGVIFLLLALLPMFDLRITKSVETAVLLQNKNKRHI